ncbi:MAG: CPBP family intramembrane glutamic endopeptidase [Bacillota bacterium]
MVVGLRGGFILLVLVIITGALVERIIPGQSTPQPYTNLILEAQSKRDLFVTLFAGVVIAPVGEELYFRGFLYNALKARMGVRLGIILASLVFAAMHFDLIRFIPLALGGAGLAYLYQRSGSILTSIFAHATWNLAMFILMLTASSLST